MGTRDRDFKDPAGEARLLAANLSQAATKIQLIEGAGSRARPGLGEEAVLRAKQEIHAIRAFRSLAHGFVSLELAGGFGLHIDLDESYRTLMDLLVNGLERPPAT
jgi:hypothetical protein